MKFRDFFGEIDPTTSPVAAGSPCGPVRKGRSRRHGANSSRNFAKNAHVGGGNIFGRTQMGNLNTKRWYTGMLSYFGIIGCKK